MMIKFEAGADYGPAFHSTLRAHFNLPAIELLISQWGSLFFRFLTELLFQPTEIDEFPYFSFNTENYLEAITCPQRLNKVQGIFWQVALSIRALNLAIFAPWWILILLLLWTCGEGLIR
jgi:hypothetical protein